ncbi:somatostatin receptor type 5-like [Pseudophryne corroboree]|uniref:somatostatin receptor type 5-like n=1 Tax=Pseudophryne corroboree TaxID=495146 RepID=UPI003081AAB3
MEKFVDHITQFNNSTDFDIYDIQGFNFLGYIYLIPYLLVFAVGFVGNALVLYIILRFRKMWTTTNIYVFSLALGDLLYMLCLLFFAIEIASSHWPLGAFMCRVLWALETMSTFSSIYFLTVMSVSVFIQLYFPAFSKKRFGLKAASLTSLVVWILCLLLGIPIFFHAGMDEYYNCSVFWQSPKARWNIIYTFVMTFLAPLTLNGICLILTATRARNQRSNVPDFCSFKENMIMVLCLIYFIAWLPTKSIELMAATSSSYMGAGAYFIVSLLPCLKSCAYPILYGFLCDSFKEAFNRVLCCTKVRDIPSQGCIQELDHCTPSAPLPENSVL